MSANNWAICPKCVELAMRRQQGASEKATQLYGKVPLEDYLAIVEAAKQKPKEPESTLREDYEIGIRNGKFYIDYLAGCSVCDFSFEHKHEERVDVSGLAGKGDSNNDNL